MSNSIPPLLCSTPPPIDFDDGGGENEPDFEPFESVEGGYSQFAVPSEPNTPKHKKTSGKNELELPIPKFIAFPTNIPMETAKIEHTDRIDKNEENEERNREETSSNSLENKIQIEPSDKSIPTKDTIGFILSEPPPIDVGYGSESQSPKNSRGDSPLSIEFSPGNLSDDDASIDFQINESRYDDNTSLPSLKFDAINISKSATPVSEDKSVTNKSPAFDELSSIDKDENQSAFDSAISIKSVDPEKESKYAVSGDVLQQDNRTKLELDGEALWTEPKFDDLDKSEMPLNKEMSIENVHHISFGESDISNITDNQTKSSNVQLYMDHKTNETQDVSSLDDDFNDDFQSFIASQKVQIDSNKEVVKELSFECNNDEIAFEADFSQVDFPPAISTFSNLTTEQSKLTTPRNQSNSIDENIDDDFEDFQDFKPVTLRESDDKFHEGKSEIIVHEEKCTSDNDKINEFNDDDFGDFGDFKEANVETSLPAEQLRAVDLPKIYEKLKSVLQLMFPVSDHIEQEATEGESCMPERLENRLSLDLQEIDSAKALEYQWLQSNIKNSLVKSLGIDSRNILYGEKWNSSMPKFAANLGFSPLEPLKPSKLHIQPSKPNSSVSVEKSLVSNNGASDVPAVKFDWNTSGLVNPLDASHAHTLLLDLDQLVVVANLDKIKLDSSSPCSSAPLTCTTTTATSTNVAHSSGDIATSTFNCIRNSYLSATDCEQLNNSEYSYSDDKYIDVMRLDSERNATDGYGGGGNDDCDENNAWININTNNLNFMTMDNMTTLTSAAIATNNINIINATNRVTNITSLGYVTNSHNDIFDQYLDCRVKEILHEGKNKTIHSTRHHDSNGSNDLATADENTTTNSQAPINFIASLSSIDNDLKDSNEITEDVISNTTHTNFISDEDYTKPTTIPSKFIPLKETHIFTPSKSDCTISRSVTKANEKGPIDFDYEIAAAGIVINEQVVNKEYRDVVYNPEAQVRSSEVLVSEIGHDDNRFKKEQINPIVDPNKNFRNKSIAPDLLSGPILNIMEKKVEIDLDDEFSDFQQNTLSSPSTNQPSEIVESTCTTTIRKTNSPTEKNFIQNQIKVENIDDEFTDFQSVAPPINTSQLKATLEVKPRSRTGTPALNDEMILSPAVLLPQAVKLICSEPKINWPGNSDIDPEELARLEQLFPQAKQVAAQSFVQNVTPPTSTEQHSADKEQKDDDDWSDFVSVPPSVNSGNQSQQEPAAVPTPTKLSTISKTYDDDDWSDFVSSTPAPVLQSTIRPWGASHLPPPQFSSWNQPSTINSLPSISTSLGGYSSNTSKTSHRNLSQQDFNRPVPTMLGKSSNVYVNNQFLMNGHYNQLGINHSHQQNNQREMKTLHHLQYHQQHHAYTSQGLPQHQHHQSQKQQRTTLNSNANINVLKSQLNLAPSISLIPDLSFAAPKPLVNLSRNNTSNKK